MVKGGAKEEEELRSRPKILSKEQAKYKVQSKIGCWLLTGFE